MILLFTFSLVKMVIKGSSIPGKKSVLVAYLLWLFGGIFGVHHFYLRRDRHAFVWWTTLGGFGIGWLGEIFKIPRYVRDANEDPKHMEELVGRMIRNKKVTPIYCCYVNYLAVTYFSRSVPSTV